MRTKYLALVITAALAAGCAVETGPLGGKKQTASTQAQKADRPGNEDSSKAFKGKMSAAETAFWEAVRDGDDDARESAVEELKADVKKDPKNAYSAFLAGSHPFHRTSAASLRALAEGSEPPSTILQVDDASADLLEKAVDGLKDPLYLGFAATLLGSAKKFTDPPEGERLFEISGKNNVPADRIGRLTFALVQSDQKKALDLLFDVMDHCLDRNADRDDPPAEEFVTKANTSALDHRECYSGYLAPHGTEGALFVGADLLAVNGKPDLAKRFYQAAAKSKTYESWKLRDLNDRRISSGGATMENMMAVVQCGTCHEK